MLSPVRGQPTEPVGSTDGQSYQDDECPSSLGLLQPAVHLCHHPDPEIESAVANMYRHEQASGMPSTDSNNNQR